MVKNRKHRPPIFILLMIAFLVTGFLIHRTVSPPEVEVQDITWSIQQKNYQVSFYVINKTDQQLDVDFMIIASSGNIGSRLGMAGRGQTHARVVLIPHEQREVHQILPALGRVSRIEVIPSVLHKN